MVQVRLSVADSAASITIMAHAINTVADQSIYAGKCSKYFGRFN